jgi:hypothetical protein
MFGSCDQGVRATGVVEVAAEASRVWVAMATTVAIGNVANSSHVLAIFILFLKYIMPYNSSLCAQPEDFQKSGSFCCSQLTDVFAFAIRSCAILQ